MSACTVIRHPKRVQCSVVYQDTGIAATPFVIDAILITLISWPLMDCFSECVKFSSFSWAFSSIVWSFRSVGRSSVASSDREEEFYKPKLSINSELICHRRHLEDVSAAKLTTRIT